MRLPIATKILLPLLCIFLGSWTFGTLSFFNNYLEQDLKRETDNFSVLILQDLKQKQELLRSQARWVADKDGLSQAITSENRGLILQTTLPIQAALQLNLIKVVAIDGEVLVDLRQGAISQSTLLDTKVIRKASIGLELSDVVSATGKDPSLLVGLISVKSQEKILGGVIVGSAITDEMLQTMRGNTAFHIVALRDSQVIASTLPDARTASWKAPLPTASANKVSIGTQEYFAKTTILSADSDTNVQIVLLMSVTPLEKAKQRLQVSIIGFCWLGSGIAFIVSIWITHWLNHRIFALTKATQTLASGDFSARLPVGNEDEVGILAQGFNFMAEQLTLRDGKIQQQMQQLEATLKKLKQTQAQLIQTEKMSSLGQMVAGIAHEINNPTSFIRGNLTHVQEYNQDVLNLLQLYQNYYPNPPKAIIQEIEAIELDFIIQDLEKIFKSMENGCDRISDIVLSLRNFSRLDEADFKQVNIHQGIDSTLMILTNRLKQQAKRPEIQVVKQYGNLPLIECYPGELNQVYMNILNNAIDILDEGVENYNSETVGEKRDYTSSLLLNSHIPTINIRTQLINQDWVAICIADNGAGMSDEVVSKVFDPFFTTKSVGKGTGLGMTVCYQIIVEKHNGQIDCYSQPQKGTEFIIKIPIKALRSK